MLSDQSDKARIKACDFGARVGWVGTGWWDSAWLQGGPHHRWGRARLAAAMPCASSAALLRSLDHATPPCLPLAWPAGLSQFYRPGRNFHSLVGSAFYVVSPQAARPLELPPRSQCRLAALPPTCTLSLSAPRRPLRPPGFPPSRQAPEVLRRDYGPSADVWSLGVSLYTLLSGLLPFFGDSEEEVFDMVLHAGALRRAVACWACWAHAVLGACCGVIAGALTRSVGLPAGGPPAKPQPEPSERITHACIQPSPLNPA